MCITGKSENTPLFLFFNGAGECRGHVRTSTSRNSSNLALSGFTQVWCLGHRCELRVCGQAQDKALFVLVISF